MKISTKLLILFLLIISLSLALISWRGLKYFISDKETYVQDINAQNLIVLSNYLADSTKKIGEELSDFKAFGEYKFSSPQVRSKALNDLQKKHSEFLSIAVFYGIMTATTC